MLSSNNSTKGRTVHLFTFVFDNQNTTLVYKIPKTEVLTWHQMLLHQERQDSFSTHLDQNLGMWRGREMGRHCTESRRDGNQ